eukprot:105827_1
MSQIKNHFTKLSDPPFINISHIFTLNRTEILVLISHSTLRQIWIYNLLNDNCTKLISQASINENIRYHTASLNDNKSFLYLFGESGKIIKLNLKTKQFE